MANVLHKTTKVYLTSVNTPEYPSDEWLINPDMSAVLGVDQKYWVIEPTTVDGEEVWIVRAMTTAEQQAYDTANPVSQATTRTVVFALTDGTPAYTYKEFLISINVFQIIFQSFTTGGASKYGLLYQNALYEYTTPRKLLLKNISIKSASGGTFTVLLKENDVEIKRYTVDGEFKENGSDIQVSANSKLTVSVEGATGIVNPSVVFDSVTYE